MMKVFQLKVSRAVLNLGVRDIGSYVGVSGTAVSSWEKGDNYSNIRTSNNNIQILEQFCMIKNILFPDEDSILLNESIEECTKSSSKPLTRFQLRGARAIMGINRKELATLAQIDQYVITRAERLYNSEYIRPKKSFVALNIENIFIRHGIFFPKPNIISTKNS